MRRDLALLMLGCLLLFFAALGSRDLWNPNEPVYGRAVVEMVEHADWVVPTFNGKPYLEKPILYYWGALIGSALLGGTDEFSLRVPTAVAGTVSVSLTYLLALPYLGRRRSLVAAALLATQFIVFSSSRMVQMDILVLMTTLGALVPLTRVADHGAAPIPHWILAGVALGLGFLAKGPVGWIVPGIAFAGYALWTRRPGLCLRPPVVVGVLVALAVAAPWFVALWLRGGAAFLDEALVRHNFGQFVEEGWGHTNPWWYYLAYVWVDMAPWSWLLPIAAFLPDRGGDERRLDSLSWIWIFGVVLFFSLSPGKRSPYVLPIAPAIALLASGVLMRLGARDLPRGRRLATLAVHGLFGALFLCGGVYLAWFATVRWPEFVSPIRLLSVVLCVAGAAVLVTATVLRHRRPAAAPIALGAGLVAIYLVLALSTFPAANALKSARGFTAEVSARLAPGTRLASYRLWYLRAEYIYYAGRNIPNLKSVEELEAFWSSEQDALLIVESKHYDEARAALGGIEPELGREIGGDTTYLFVKP